MKINVKNIPSEGLEIQGTRQVRVEGIGKTDAELDLRVSLVSEDVMVDGKVTAAIGLECGRCLGSFNS